MDNTNHMNIPDDFGKYIFERAESELTQSISLAKSGVDECLVIAAMCYLHGYPVNRDVQRALKYIKRAARRRDWSGMGTLATMYERGILVERSLPMAIELTQRQISKIPRNYPARLTMARLLWEVYGNDKTEQILQHLKVVENNAAYSHEVAEIRAKLRGDHS